MFSLLEAFKSLERLKFIHPFKVLTYFPTTANLISVNKPMELLWNYLLMVLL